MEKIFDVDKLSAISRNRLWYFNSLITNLLVKDLVFNDFELLVNENSLEQGDILLNIYNAVATVSYIVDGEESSDSERVNCKDQKVLFKQLQLPICPVKEDGLEMKSVIENKVSITLSHKKLTLHCTSFIEGGGEISIAKGWKNNNYIVSSKDSPEFIITESAGKKHHFIIDTDSNIEGSYWISREKKEI